MTEPSLRWLAQARQRREAAERRDRMDFEQLKEHCDELRKEAAKLQLNMERLLKQVGDVGECKGCGATIYWVKHKSGKKAPYTPFGLNHFADCPKAQSFR